MIQSAYGHRLVQLYNERHGARYDARGFFDEVFFPVVYDDRKPLQNIGNSPFFVLFEKSEWKKNPPPQKRREALAQLHHKADTEPPDGSFLVGFPAAGAQAVTSGQVSNIAIPGSRDDVFASWIGAALALTVGGGFSLLIEDDEVLWTTFEGWPLYRRFVNHPPVSNLKGRQINTWNTWWLAHRLSDDYLPGTLPDYKDAALDTMEWAWLVMALAGVYPSRTLTAYVFNLGNTNTTVGFLPVRLPEVARMYAILNQYFSNEAGLSDTKRDRLYRTDESFRSACERGAIGLQSMPPSGLTNFFPGPNSSIPNKPLEPVDYFLYQTWILAMLGPDHEDLYQLARQTAESLATFASEERGTARDNLVKELLNQTGKRSFIQKLTEIVESDPARFPALEKLAARAYAMSLESLRLFITLIKFQYAGKSRQTSSEKA